MRLVLCFSAGLAWTLALANLAQAQSWSAARARPSLYEIIAVDPASGGGWPFGTEDPAGDGLSTLEPDEAAIDLRSVYADARAGKLWLRAYVTAKLATEASALAYFFVDADLRTQTGGPASDDKLWPRLTSDPSAGGYEHAIGMRGDGTLVAFYSWNTKKSAWEEQPGTAPQLAAESGIARDPLRLAGDDHAYYQITLPLSVLDLDERCLANVFVRTANDTTGKRAFGDVVDSFAGTCRPHLNRYGDPEILKTDSCSVDDSCPGGGRCRDGICVFGYECSGDVGCKTGQRCTSSVCVLVVERSCSGNADCDGLLCDSKQCVACSESGARACPSDSVCAPDGRCLKPSGSTIGGGNGSAGSAAASGIRVRGGAFSCSLAAARGEHGWLLALGLVELWRRRRRRTRDVPARGES